MLQTLVYPEPPLMPVTCFYLSKQIFFGGLFYTHKPPDLYTLCAAFFVGILQSSSMHNLKKKKNYQSYLVRVATNIITVLLVSSSFDCIFWVFAVSLHFAMSPLICVLFLNLIFPSTPALHQLH